MWKHSSQMDKIEARFIEKWGFPQEELIFTKKLFVFYNHIYVFHRQFFQHSAEMHVRLWQTLLILCKPGVCPKKFSTILTECLWKTKNSPVDFFSKQHLIFYATQQFLSTLPCFHILQILFFHSPVFCSFSPLFMGIFPIDPFFSALFIIKIPLLYGYMDLLTFVCFGIYFAVVLSATIWSTSFEVSSIAKKHGKMCIRDSPGSIRFSW